MINFDNLASAITDRIIVPLGMWLVLKIIPQQILAEC
jgi:hypothetical protein